MTTITDEDMMRMLTTTKEYCLVLLKPGPKSNEAGIQKILWEHARRNFALRADGLLHIVGPITQETGVSGMGIFNTDATATQKIMDEDPAVLAGIFVYEVYPLRSFPGDSLPA